jgi:hypothetical protein
MYFEIYCSGLEVITAEETEPHKERTTLGCSGRIALRREQCGVFTPYKNCNIETRGRVTAPAVMSCVRTCQQLEAFSRMSDPRVYSGCLVTGGETMRRE